MLTIGVEGVCEVSGRSVHVYILSIETRSTLREGFAEHEANLGEESLRARAAEPVRRLVEMDAGRPERLVGVDVPDAAHEGLVEQRALDARVAPREGVEE